MSRELRDMQRVCARIAGPRSLYRLFFVMSMSQFYFQILFCPMGFDLINTTPIIVCYMLNTYRP